MQNRAHDAHWMDEQDHIHGTCRCGHDCSTHPDAGNSLAGCGDCGADTCPDCRVDDEATRCVECAAVFYAAQKPKVQLAIDTYGGSATAAMAIRAAHREQCFDAIRRVLGLGDTKGDTGLWLDWIDAVAAGRTADEVVQLTMKQKRIEGTLGSRLPPVNWTVAEFITRRIASRNQGGR
jgi:hypothetical protein